jgi:uncharacterized protein YecT (DUF1311 family)
MIRHVLLMLLLATPAFAQTPDFSPAATQSCLLRTYDSVGCIGVSAEVCIAAQPGASEAVQMACFDAERAYWDDRLEEAHANILAAAGVSDDMLQDETEVLRQVPAIRAMQERWVAYRDAFCAFEESVWAGAAGADAAVRQCLMTLTALQVLLLESGMEIH